MTDRAAKSEYWTCEDCGERMPRDLNHVCPDEVMSEPVEWTHFNGEPLPDASSNRVRWMPDHRHHVDYHEGDATYACLVCGQRFAVRPSDSVECPGPGRSIPNRVWAVIDGRLEPSSQLPSRKGRAPRDFASRAFRGLSVAS